MNQGIKSQSQTLTTAKIDTHRGLLQRKCSCARQSGEDDQVRRQKKSSFLQRRAANHDAPPAVPSIVGKVLRSSAKPLDATTRINMESGFAHSFAHVQLNQAKPQVSSASLVTDRPDSGYESEADRVASAVMQSPRNIESPTEFQHAINFEGVRLHTGYHAAKSARAMNAKAYTVGNHIVFGSGNYNPRSTAGKRLLAHELTHVLQQSGTNTAPTGILQRTIGDGHDLTATRFRGNVVLEAAYDDERLIRKGDTGLSVTLIQQSLIDQGYPLPFRRADGVFGDETVAAVKRFQTDAGAVLIDGIVGPETMELLDRHDTTGAGHPPATTGPIPAPAPALATCNAPFSGVTFSLANQNATGSSPAANIRVASNHGHDFLFMQGTTPINYDPEITIQAPNDPKAREFQVGFAQNVLSTNRVASYLSGTTIRTTLPNVPIKDGAPGGSYNPIFVSGPHASLLENFTANGDTVNLDWPDAPADGAFIDLLNNPSCSPLRTPSTLSTMTMRDEFRIWVLVRHIPSGCVHSLHHVDWNLNWSAGCVTVPIAGTVCAAGSNVNNVTEANGDGSPRFVQGGPVPADVVGKTCT